MKLNEVFTESISLDISKPAQSMGNINIDIHQTLIMAYSP